MNSFLAVLKKVLLRRKLPADKTKKRKMWQPWMDKSLDRSVWFYCERLNFVTQPVICISRRIGTPNVPINPVCQRCPLGDKLQTKGCIGRHGRYAYCVSCIDRKGCKTITDLTKNPERVNPNLAVSPSKEIPVPKSTAKNTKKNGKAADDEEEDDEEEEETEEEETEEEEDEEEEEEEEEEGDEEEEEEEEKPKKKAKKKGGNTGGLVPREPVKVPKEVLKSASPAVKKLLKEREAAQAKGDKDALRKIRAGLRKEGFNLSKLNAG